MIIKIKSPLQEELQVGDRLEIVESAAGPPQTFKVIRVDHTAGVAGNYTEMEFEWDVTCVSVDAGTLFRTPYCTWALDQPITLTAPGSYSMGAKVGGLPGPGVYTREFAGSFVPQLTIDKDKILARIAELHKWRTDTPEKEEMLIQNLGSLVIAEVLAPVVEFAEENLQAKTREQFYRLTRDMFVEEMELVQKEFFPVEWLKGRRRDEESLMEKLKKKIYPITTEIIRKASEIAPPEKRIISRPDAPWGV